MIIKLDGYGEKIYSNNRFDELLAGKGLDGVILVASYRLTVGV